MSADVLSFDTSFCVKFSQYFSGQVSTSTEMSDSYGWQTFDWSLVQNESILSSPVAQKAEEKTIQNLAAEQKDVEPVEAGVSSWSSLVVSDISD